MSPWKLAVTHAQRRFEFEKLRHWVPESILVRGEIVFSLRGRARWRETRTKRRRISREMRRPWWIMDRKNRYGRPFGVVDACTRSEMAECRCPGAIIREVDPPAACGIGLWWFDDSSGSYSSVTYRRTIRDDIVKFRLARKLKVVSIES